MKFCDICEYSIIDNEAYRTSDEGTYAHESCIADVYGAQFEEIVEET